MINKFFIYNAGKDSLSNVFVFNDNNCKSQAEGLIDINMDLAIKD